MAKFLESSVFSVKTFKGSLLFLRRPIAKCLQKPVVIILFFFKEMEIAADQLHLLL